MDVSKSDYNYFFVSFFPRPPTMTTSESSQFEGPEKLLEIWFAPSSTDVESAAPAEGGKCGLRRVDRAVWEDMLEIVKCKVLSVVEGSEMDAYLLRSVAPPLPVGLQIHDQPYT